MIELLKNSHYDEEEKLFLCDFSNDDNKKFKVDVRNNKLSVISYDYR